MAESGPGARQALAGAAGVLSDLDGTLIDSSAPARRAWFAFAERHGLDREEVLAFAQGKPSRETVRTLVPAGDPRAEARRLERAEVGDVDGVVALAGAQRLLFTYPRLAIVTSCSLALARVRLDAAGLPCPDILVSSDDVARGKPDPGPFLLGAQRLGVSPSSCVALEDAPAGIRSARAAGARVIALLGTHSRDALVSAGADWVVDGLDELMPPR